jgi:hypothetical protein
VPTLPALPLVTASADKPTDSHASPGGVNKHRGVRQVLIALAGVNAPACCAFHRVDSEGGGESATALSTLVRRKQHRHYAAKRITLAPRHELRRTAPRNVEAWVHSAQRRYSILGGHPNPAINRHRKTGH